MGETQVNQNLCINPSESGPILVAKSVQKTQKDSKIGLFSGLFEFQLLKVAPYRLLGLGSLEKEDLQGKCSQNRNVGL